MGGGISDVSQSLFFFLQIKGGGGEEEGEEEKKERKRKEREKERKERPSPFPQQSLHEIFDLSVFRSSEKGRILVILFSNKQGKDGG